ncbi:hypothetical protein MKW94_017363 [Papaver nudicaule]|uniref:ubiquitinyl hydrolase 1 n=1 Tax=Papaver nudicaule TaxID=74823 RepID=A0AA41VL16_PAPNU|nr:hypothetical protein [Papaver nudicaule]
MKLKFRAAVFALEPELLREIPVLDELANLFARLHSSEQAYIDSGPFAKTLNLDNTVQQDSHEFLTLLMTLLESSLGRSNVASARTIVQDLFRGHVAMVTLCSKCGKTSPRIEEFYELQLNIDGFKTLDESLADYFSVEELCGDNQYFCETCGGTLVEGATRSIKLRTLPEVLNFQLKRCVFVPKNTTRKKVTSSISFPGELQMNQRLLEPSDSEIIYDLSAILAHKGAGVDSGHYLSLIKDERTGEWWEFDDEVVSKKGSHPFAEGPPSSTAEPMEIETDLKPPCSELMVVSNGKNHVNVGQSTSSASNTDCRANTFESADAYMLMYTRRSTTGSKDKAFKDKERSSEPLPPNNDKSLPPHLFEEIKAFNELYVTDCRNYKEKKEKETVRISERRQEVRSILSEAPVPSGEEPYFWIATDWLRQWCDGTLPPAIDNTSIQCSHGGVSVLQVGSMKRLSRSAWAQLLFQCGGGPALSNAVHCKDCIRNRANMMVQADNYRDQRSAFKEIADASLAGKSLEGALYFVSRSWLQQWSRRRNVDFPSEADIGPTASIRCPHGELIPEQAAGTKRVLVPEDLWLFLYEDSIKMKPEDALVCTTFLSEAETCAVCHAKANEVASSEETQRAFKVKERQNHEKLLTEKSIALNPGCKYYLLPSSWLTKWKTYLTASARSTLLSARPDPLEGVINSLICEKHSRLLERPLHLVCKHDTISQKPSTTYGLTIISENDWKLFCEDWQCNISKCVSAEIEFISGDVKKLVGSCEEMSISEGNLNPSNDGANDEVESRQSIIKTSPMICEECIGERESRELMQKLSYCNEEISVYLVRGKEAVPPKSVLDASCRVSDPERRSSKRPRKASNGNLVNLTVSGSTTIYQLKMKIWESLEVVKENQMLHKGSNLIDEEESATLADMHIFPGDVLWVRDSGKYQNCDITGNLTLSSL